MSGGAPPEVGATLPTVRVFGEDLAAADLPGVVDEIVRLARRPEASYVVTMNVDHVVDLAKSERFRRAYERSSLRIADGAPVVFTARLAGRPLPARVTGADLMPALCRRAEAEGLRVVVLGGAGDVNEAAVAALRERHPALDVSGWSPFGFDRDESVSAEMAARLREVAPQLTFVCFGAPRSEIWLSEHLELLPPGVAVCAGAAVDFAAGSRRRAPRWMQVSGLEWCYRLVQEPGRLWRRYLVKDSVFVPIAAREVWRARVRSART